MIIKVLRTSGAGITGGINSMIKLINTHPTSLIKLYHINSKRASTFIALFKEPNTIAEFVAFIHEWGTKSGGGTGDRGFAQMMSCVEKHNISMIELDWDAGFSEEWKIKLNPYQTKSVREHLSNWEEWLLQHISSSHPWLPTDDEPINVKWSNWLKQRHI